MYETARAERDVVVLNDIHIDIMDYINPASCVDVQFRSMWAEFEWENKVCDAILPWPASLFEKAVCSTQASSRKQCQHSRK